MCSCGFFRFAVCVPAKQQCRLRKEEAPSNSFLAQPPVLNFLVWEKALVSGSFTCATRCTVRACFCRVGVAASSTRGSLGCCPHDSYYLGRQGSCIPPSHTVRHMQISAQLVLLPTGDMAPHSSTLTWKIPWTEEPGGLQSMGSLTDGHDWVTSVSLFTFHFRALEKEMATHSSVLVWRIPGMGEPGGLPSVGLHRVGHD